MAHRQTSVTRAVAMFALAGLIVLIIVAIAGIVVLRRIGTDQAMQEAERITEVAGNGIVGPRLKNGVIKGGAETLAKIDDVVRGAVLRDPIAHVRIWNEDGRIVYSDVLELIGQTYELDETQREALETGQVVAVRSDPDAPDNVMLQIDEPLLEVSLPVTTPNGTPLLFQAYLTFDSIADSGRELWQTFLPVLAATLIALALLQIPLAYRMAGRVRDSQAERERLLQHAVEASDLERRRIAAGLHDGTVQQLAGLSMSLAAQGDALSEYDPDTARALTEAAEATRQSMRSLRSVLMGIYPPNLRSAGLAAALADLVAPLPGYGVAPSVDVAEGLEVSPDTEALLFRASQEAVRNVTTHARASRVNIRVRGDGELATLEIDDDGVGFTPEDRDAAAADGHLGLRLISDLATDAHGNFEVRSAPGEGTSFRLEVPR